MTDFGGAGDVFGHYYESDGPPAGVRARMEALELPEWSGPTPLMVSALRRVQHDLDAVGLDRYVLSFAVAGGAPGEPIVNVQWRGTWTSDGLDFEGDDPSSVTVDVAAQAAQGLIELEDVYWPTCPGHGCLVRAADQGGDAVWWCEKSGAAPHLVAKIGELRTDGEGAPNAPLWRTLDQLASP